MMNRFIAYNMPKIELHCHLDGSMSVELTQKLLADMGEEYTKEELQEALTAPMDCPSLADYLKRFDLPIRCLQTKKDFAPRQKACTACGKGAGKVFGSKICTIVFNAAGTENYRDYRERQ